MASVAIKDRTKVKLDDYCEKAGKSKVDIVTDAVEKYLKEVKK